MGIRWRIILAMVFVGLLIISIMGLFAIKTTSDILDIRAKEFLSVLLDRSKSELNQQITITQNNTRALYDDFDISFDLNRLSQDKNYLGIYLDKMRPAVKLASELNASKTAFLIIYHPTEAKKIIGGIFYSDIDRNGVPEETDLALLIPFITSDDPPIISTESSTFNWLIHSENSMVSCFSVVAKDDQIIAIMGTAIKMDFMIDRIRRIKYLNSGFMFLSNENNQIIYHPNLDFGISTDLSFANKQSEITNKESSTALFLNTTDNELNEIILGRTTLANGWELNIQIDQTEIKEGLASRFVGIILVALIALFVALVVAFITAKQISEPYVHLTEEMKKVGQGDYGIRIRDAYLMRTDEIGILSQTFILMVQQTQKNFEDIQNYNNNLKSLVDVRTEELSNTNTHLEESLAETVEKQAQLLRSNELLQASLETIKQTQRELLRVEKIAALTYIVAGVAHKINTPLGNAFTSASYLQSRIDDLKLKYESSQLKQSDFAAFIESVDLATFGLITNLDQSIRLINRFKELAVNKTDIPNTRSVFLSVIQEQWLIVKQHSPNINCTLSTSIPPDMAINCSKNVLESLFFELLKNSFTHGFSNTSSPEITISIRRFSGPSTLNSDEIGYEIFYRDNGVGISSEQEEKIFTPFYTTKMSKDHDGLGLNMVYNLIIAVFNGEIQVIDMNLPGLAYRILIYEPKREAFHGKAI